MSDHVLGDAQDRIRYKDAAGAISYVINILFGNADDEPFWAFDDPTELVYLYTFYALAGFIIMILLLNVLVAIMNDAQQQRT